MSFISQRLVKVYKTLSENQRNNFWLAATNIFLVVFTFWLGLTIQYIVADNNAKLKSKLVQLEYYKNINEDKNAFIRLYNLTVDSGQLDLKEAESTMLILKYGELMAKEQSFMKLIDRTDSIISLSNKLGWILSTPKQQFKLKKEIESATIYNGLFASAINYSIPERKYKENDSIYEYFDSDKFMNQTNIIIPKDIKTQVSDYFDEIKNLSATTNVEVCMVLQKKIAISVSNIFDIISRDLNLMPNTLLERTATFFSSIPTFIKSTIILIILLIIGYVVANRLLLNMCLPSDNRLYTKEDDECLFKENSDKDDIINNEKKVM